MSVPAWLWLLWVLMGLTLELIAVFNKKPDDTLTQTILHHTPGIAVLLAVTWVFLHFTSRVFRNWRSGKHGDGL